MTTELARSGEYPIERRAGELERLALQQAAMAPDTDIMLDRIGVGAGWRCLDLGCGPGGITDLLGDRVGPSGRVVGLDFDPVFIEHARANAGANTEFVQGDAYRTGLADASFDLVHTRFLACTAGEPERLLAEAVRLARPGGVVAMQESEFSSLNCYPPHRAWSMLRAALAASFPGSGEDPVAQRLYRLMRRAGLVNVQYRPFLLGVPFGDPWRDYLPATIESARSTVTGRGLIAADLLDRTLAACRSHLADPETVFTSFTVVQVWGRIASRAADGVTDG